MKLLEQFFHCEIINRAAFINENDIILASFGKGSAACNGVEFAIAYGNLSAKASGLVLVKYSFVESGKYMEISKLCWT